MSLLEEYNNKAPTYYLLDYDDNILDEYVGYIVCIGVGLFITLCTTVCLGLNRSMSAKSKKRTAETFNSAGRSVRTGLIAAVIVSQWTWAATILQSSTVAWKYGISGPFWYAAGASIQVIIFGIMSVEIKRKAPRAHTITEIIRSRWGNTAHKTFLYFCLLTNVLVTSMLVLGGSATINVITGLPTTICNFLVPLGIILYTYSDGLKATFISGYINATVIQITMLIFLYVIYIHSPALGSFEKVFNGIVTVENFTPEECKERFDQALNVGLNDYFPSDVDDTFEDYLLSCGPINGNKEGSYLTMWSIPGLMFGVINIIGNFGTIFADQAYWQAAIAAKPQAARKAYLVGGLCWFAIPFAMSTALGLSAVSLGLVITKEQANEGLVPTATCLYLLGKAGTLLLTILLFVAVVSTGASELIAMSSLLTYDVYSFYLSPYAKNKEMLKVSRICVVLCAILMGCLGSLFNVINVNLNYLYLLMGVLIGSAVPPIAAVLLNCATSSTGAISSAWCGQILGIISWLSTAYYLHGEISITSTSNDICFLVGNLTSIVSSALIIVIQDRIWPDDYDWISTRRIEFTRQDTVSIYNDDSYVGTSQPSKVQNDQENSDESDGNDENSTPPPMFYGLSDSYQENYRLEPNYLELKEAKSFIVKYGLSVSVVLAIIWPACALISQVFNLQEFTTWVSISMIWAVISALIIIFLPIIESRRAIFRVASGVIDRISESLCQTRVDNKETIPTKTSQCPKKPNMQSFPLEIESSEDSVAEETKL